MQIFTSYGTSWVQAIVPSAIPLDNLGEPNGVNQNFQTNSETCTMAYTGHT
jgi:hypothetical protein